MKTTKKTFFVGYNDKDTKTQILSDAQIEETIQVMVTKFWEYGATITSHKGESGPLGVYKHDDWAIVNEKTAIITVYSEDCHRGFVQALKSQLNQESILVHCEPALISFE
jgi:hypothetical protein